MKTHRILLHIRGLFTAALVLAIMPIHARAAADTAAQQAEFVDYIKNIFADFIKKNPGAEKDKLEEFIAAKKITGLAAQALRTKLKTRKELVESGLPTEVLDAYGATSPARDKPEDDTAKKPENDSEKGGLKKLFEDYREAAEKRDDLKHDSSDGAKTRYASANKDVKEVARKIMKHHVSHPLTASKFQTIFHTGVKLLSPYQFRYDSTLSKGFVDKAGKGDVSAFAELAYASRTAWNPARLDRLVVDERRWYDFIDVDARLGYDFSNGGGKDASAIAGSGDIDTQLSLGAPIRGNHLGTPGAGQGGWTLGPEVSLGLVTDRASFDVRQRWFGGLAFASRSAASGNETGMLFLMRLGYAAIDSVEYISSGTHEVRVAHGDLPDYRLQSALALEGDVFYPFGNSNMITLGGRIYDGPKPNTWMLYIGYSIDPGAVAKGLFPKMETSTAKAGAAEVTGK